MTARGTLNETVMNVTPGSCSAKFDLSELGPNPNVTAVTISAIATRDDDYFRVSAPKTTGLFMSKVSIISAVPLTGMQSYIQDRASIGDCTLTIQYHGEMEDTGGAPSGASFRWTTSVAFVLHITVDGQAVTDYRSDGSLSADSVDLGQNVTFNITPFHTSYKHTLTYKVGNYTSGAQSVAPGVTSHTFAPPLQWASEIPDSDAGTMTVILDTLRPADASNPDTTYESAGTREYSMQVVVPSNLQPTMQTVSMTVDNPGTLPANKIFTGVSRIRFSIASVTPSTGAGVAKITFTGWGDTLTLNKPKPSELTNISVLSNVVRITGNLTITVTVTDSRGRTFRTVMDMGQAIQYTPPSLTVVECVRCRPDGEAYDRGTAFKTTVSFQCDTQAISGNTARAYCYIRPYNSDTWSSAFALTSGSERILTDADIGYELSHEVSYEVRFVVEDNAMTIASNLAIEMYYRLSSLQFALYFANNGRAVGIGKQADDLEEGQEGRLDVNPDWAVYLGEHTYIGGTAIANLITMLSTLNANVSAMQTQIGALQTAVSDIQNQLNPPESSG